MTKRAPSKTIVPARLDNINQVHQPMNHLTLSQLINLFSFSKQQLNTQADLVTKAAVVANTIALKTTKCQAAI